MADQFLRTELLLGKEAMNSLKKAHVAVFGIGGVGGHTAEALARSGIGKIDLIDNDTVSITNINRQIIALMSTVGRLKTEVMKERILDINPEAEVVCHNMFFLPENSSQIDFSRYSYVIDAVDTVAAKIEIISKAKESKVPVISSMGAGGKLCPEMFEVADIKDTSVCPLARVMRRELKNKGITCVKVVYSKEKSIKPISENEEESGRIPGSTAFSPAVAGLIIASEVVKDLIKEDKKSYDL